MSSLFLGKVSPQNPLVILLSLRLKKECDCEELSLTDQLTHTTRARHKNQNLMFSPQPSRKAAITSGNWTPWKGKKHQSIPLLGGLDTCCPMLGWSVPIIQCIHTLEQGWFDWLRSVPCRCWCFAGMEQVLPAEHSSKRMFLRLLWNPFEVVSLLLKRPSVPINVKRIAQHEPQSAHEWNATQRQEECASLELPFSPVPCTMRDAPQTCCKLVQLGFGDSPAFSFFSRSWIWISIWSIFCPPDCSLHFTERENIPADYFPRV